MRVLVCGGRDYRDVKTICATLDALHAKHGVTCVIEGGAQGADCEAANWADGVHGVAHELYDADWRSFGKKAGPMRNQKMLDEGKPDLVVAFPGGRGTADMVRRAAAAGVPVQRVT